MSRNDNFILTGGTDGWSEPESIFESIEATRSWDGLVDAMITNMAPEQLARAIRRLFWVVHRKDVDQALVVLADLEVESDEGSA